MVKDQRSWQKEGSAKDFGKAQVTVFSLVYNHEKFIHQACESFLNQKTSFPIQIYFHDDASADASPSILLSYQKKFPSIIRLKIRRKNIYRTGRRDTYLREALAVTTPYVALCEGDDFFTAEHKLETQIRFLEQRPAATGCFHNSIRVDERSLILDGSFCPLDKSVFGQREVLTELYAKEATSSCFFRRGAIPEIPDWYRDRPCDFFLDLLITSRGDYCYINQNMSAYRTHRDGIWGLKNWADTKREFLIRFETLLRHPYWREKYGEVIGKEIEKWHQP